MSPRTSRFSSLVATFLLAGSAASAQPCPIVDRGSPTDGITTITVIEPPAPCIDGPLWAGWLCMKVRSDANSNGVHYGIDIRWNRANLPVRGSFTWLKGGNSTQSIRETSLFGAAVQDLLDRLDQIRTIELRFLGQGTFTPPQNGFVNISAVYADVLELLVTQGIARGVVGHYGNSGGSMMGANALAYHGVEELLDGVVFGGGPFWSDLEETCTDPTSPVFASDHIRERVDDLNWRDLNGGTWCFDQAPRSEPPYTCRSTLGVEADAEYPQAIVSVVVGTEDNPWIDASASEYWAKVTALRKTFDRPLAPHLVVDSEAGAAAVYARITEIVASAPLIRPKGPPFGRR